MNLKHSKVGYKNKTTYIWHAVWQYHLFRVMADHLHPAGLGDPPLPQTQVILIQSTPASGRVVILFWSLLISQNTC